MSLQLFTDFSSMSGVFMVAKWLLQPRSEPSYKARGEGKCGEMHTCLFHQESKKVSRNLSAHSVQLSLAQITRQDHPQHQIA